MYFQHEHQEEKRRRQQTLWLLPVILILIVVMVALVAVWQLRGVIGSNATTARAVARTMGKSYSGTVVIARNEKLLNQKIRRALILSRRKAAMSARRDLKSFLFVVMWMRRWTAKLGNRQSGAQ